MRIILFLLLTALSIHAQTDTGKITDRKPYVFGAYEKVDGLRKAVSKSDYETAVADKRFVLEELKYQSDGLSVTAYLYRPVETKGKKFPLIIFNRGSYIVGDLGAELAPMFRRLAAEGFVVLAPLLRASNGAPGKDEVGGADLNDLMNTLPLIRSLEFLDEKNLFMYGHSRGGMMTFQAIRDGFPLNAAATVGGFTDFNALVTSRPDQYDPLIKQIWPDYAAHKDEIIQRRSAVRWVDRLNVPLLLMHGGGDYTVNPEQTLNLAQLLQKAGKNYELLIVNGETHSISHDDAYRDARVVVWFKRHMK